MSHEHDMEQAERAKRLLEEGIFVDAVRQVRSRYHDAWEGAATPENREHYWSLVTALNDVVTELSTVIVGAGENARYAARTPMVL